MPAGVEIFDPAALTHGVALELVEAAAEKGLWLDSAIDPAAPARVRGDAAGIRRVLRVLAGQAVAATQRGYIAVSLTVERAGPGRCTLLFSVVDTAAVRHRDPVDVFPEHALAGSEERPEGGCRAWLSVPVEPLDAALPPESPTARLERLTAWARARGGRVLVVDDSATNRIITAALLGNTGFSSALAEGGAEAVRMMTAEAFDAVLMDVAMPQMDGLAATRTIRTLPGARAAVPIIAMTAHAFPEDRDRCLAAGMDDYLPKPFQTLDLLEALERRLG